MIATNPAGNTAEQSGTEKKIEDGLSAIVVAGPDAYHVAGFAIDKAVDDNLEANQAWKGRGKG